MSKDVYDWEDTITRGLLPQLKRLRNHIEKHDFIADAEDVVTEIDGAFVIWDCFQRDAVSWEEENETFEAFMDYLKTHMKKWWC